jgi:hypothetical protein
MWLGPATPLPAGAVVHTGSQRRGRGGPAAWSRWITARAASGPGTMGDSLVRQACPPATTGRARRRALERVRTGPRRAGDREPIRTATPKRLKDRQTSESRGTPGNRLNKIRVVPRRPASPSLFALAPRAEPAARTIRRVRPLVPQESRPRAYPISRRAQPVSGHASRPGDGRGRPAALRRARLSGCLRSGLLPTPGSLRRALEDQSG